MSEKAFAEIEHCGSSPEASKERLSVGIHKVEGENELYASRVSMFAYMHAGGESHGI